MIEQYIGEIVLGSSGVIITLVIGGIRSIFSRIRKLEDRVSKNEGDIKLNTALDKERAN